MKKLLVIFALMFGSVVNTMANPILSQPNVESESYVTNLHESTLVLKVKMDDHFFRFHVYEKEMIDNNSVYLYGKSPYKNLNKILVTRDNIIIYAGNKQFIIKDDQLFNQIEVYIEDIPNLIRK
jgi:hypothetical protein